MGITYDANGVTVSPYDVEREQVLRGGDDLRDDRYVDDLQPQLVVDGILRDGSDPRRTHRRRAAGGLLGPDRGRACRGHHRREVDEAALERFGLGDELVQRAEASRDCFLEGCGVEVRDAGEERIRRWLGIIELNGRSNDGASTKVGL